MLGGSGAVTPVAIRREAAVGAGGGAATRMAKVGDGRQTLSDLFFLLFAGPSYLFGRRVAETTLSIGVESQRGKSATLAEALDRIYHASRSHLAPFLRFHLHPPLSEYPCASSLLLLRLVDVLFDTFM